MLTLNDALSVSEGMIGTKAFRLAKLRAAGFPVKAALVLTIDEVVAISEGEEKLSEMADTVRALLTIDSSGVAVRSSGVGEDGALSWAGQFKSRLFVRLEEFPEAVKDCIAAGSGATVEGYARLHGIPVPRLALIVQEMVDASMSGVLFTRDPVQLQDRVMVLETVDGVAEALVSGQVMPHRIYFGTDSLEVIRAEGAAVPEVTSAQIAELAHWGREAVRLFGKEQDIEWAFDRSGRLFIQQSRDITTSARVEIVRIRSNVIEQVGRELTREHERLARLGLNLQSDVLSDQNIAELLTHHPRQMALGMFTYGFAHGEGGIRSGRNEMGYAIGEELDQGFFLLVGGQPRCSIIHDAFTYRISGIPLADYAKLVNFYLQRIRENPSLANYPEIVLYNQNPDTRFLEEHFGRDKSPEYQRAYRRFYEGIRIAEDSIHETCARDFVPTWQSEMVRIRAEIERGITDSEALIDFYHLLCDRLRTYACSMFVKVARLGFFAYARLRNLLTELFGGEGQVHLDTVTAGIPIELNPNLSLSIELKELRDGRSSLDALVTRFGHLSWHELEISVPRYRERPEIFSELASRIDRDPREQFTDVAGASRALQEKLLEGSGSRREELEREIQIARRYLPLREVVKFEFLKAYDLARYAAQCIERQLGWSEGLIFNLNPSEVFRLNVEPEALRILAEERMRQWEDNQALYVPAVIFSDRLDEVGYPPAEGASRILRGIGVTSFTTEGEVVIAHRPDDPETLRYIRSGSIIVTVTTDPSWTTILSLVGKKGGLVTEVGGLLAHGAIYAREAGIAAVLNVPRATTILKAGMRVRVNGPQGYVEIL